jgi:hypothetical protein
MNGKKSKWLKALVRTRNPVLLLMVRNEFGEKTQGMNYDQLYKISKKLYKQGKIQKVKGWPSARELRKMKGRELFNVPVVEGSQENQATVHEGTS